MRNIKFAEFSCNIGKYNHFLWMDPNHCMYQLTFKTIKALWTIHTTSYKLLLSKFWIISLMYFYSHGMRGQSKINSVFLFILTWSRSMWVHTSWLLLSCIYTRAKANFFFDFCHCCCCCSINTQIENNATDWKGCRFRFSINATLQSNM